MKTKNNNIAQRIAMMLILFSISSCDSFVDVDLPKSQLINVSVFEDNSTADAALTSIYAQIRDEGMLTGNSYGISSLLGHYTDELTAYGASSSPNWNFYNNSILPSNSDITSYWNSAYSQI